MAPATPRQRLQRSSVLCAAGPIPPTRSHLSARVVAGIDAHQGSPVAPWAASRAAAATCGGLNSAANTPSSHALAAHTWLSSGTHTCCDTDAWGSTDTGAWRVVQRSRCGMSGGASGGVGLSGGGHVGEEAGEEEAETEGDGGDGASGLLCAVKRLDERDEMHLHMGSPGRRRSC